MGPTFLPLHSQDAMSYLLCSPLPNLKLKSRGEGKRVLKRSKVYLALYESNVKTENALLMVQK